MAAKISISLGAILLILVPACSYVSPMPKDEKPLSRELARLSGVEVLNCGEFPLGADLKAGWNCAQSADAAGKAFWFAVQRRGIDSDIWEAVGRTATRERYFLVYDSNPFGGAEIMPRFTRDTCQSGFLFHPERNGALSCQRMLETRMLTVPAAPD